MCWLPLHVHIGEPSFRCSFWFEVFGLAVCGSVARACGGRPDRGHHCARLQDANNALVTLSVDDPLNRGALATPPMWEGDRIVD